MTSAVRIMCTSPSRDEKIAELRRCLAEVSAHIDEVTDDTLATALRVFALLAAEPSLKGEQRR